MIKSDRCVTLRSLLTLTLTLSRLLLLCLCLCLVCVYSACVPVSVYMNLQILMSVPRDAVHQHDQIENARTRCACTGALHESFLLILHSAEMLANFHHSQILQKSFHLTQPSHLRLAVIFLNLDILVIRSHHRFYLLVNIGCDKGHEAVIL